MALVSIEPKVKGPHSRPCQSDILQRTNFAGGSLLAFLAPFPEEDLMSGPAATASAVGVSKSVNKPTDVKKLK